MSDSIKQHIHIVECALKIYIILEFCVQVASSLLFCPENTMSFNNTLLLFVVLFDRTRSYILNFRADETYSVHVIQYQIVSKRRT